MKKLLAAAAVLLALSGTHAAAQAPGLTAEVLYSWCTTKVPRQPADVTGKEKQDAKLLNQMTEWAGFHKASRLRERCMYYVLGIADGIGVFAKLHNVKDCVPNGVKASSLADLVVNYYDNVPAERHLDAMDFVTLAFVNAFNCKKTENNAKPSSERGT
jgi:hypothetical protein